MNENSMALNASTTPKNANSPIINVKSRVSNILFTSLSKWFSPSDQNGNVRRKRESESDNGVSDVTSTNVAPPPAKRFRSVEEQDEIEPHPTTSRNQYSTQHFSPSTPTTTTPTRRKMLATFRNSTPYNFDDQALGNTSRLSQREPATILIDDDGENSTDEETNANDDVILTDSFSRELSNRKCLNIPLTTRQANRTSYPLSVQSTVISRLPASHTVARDLTKDDDIEHDAVFNGTQNESASESEDSSSRITFTQPNKYTTNRPQSSAGRINTSLVRADDIDSSQRRRSGLFGTGGKKFLRTTNNGLMNFSAHLQSSKSLFSDKNMPKSLNNSTSSLNSLNRRQSLNNSLYGSTSALSDSRLLNTNSPFYCGRTMYGGASAYSRRAIWSQRSTVCVPTQIRPSSSSSTLYSSTNSLSNVDPNTSALSNTAKRILDLMNQCTTPLADVKKMASNATSHAPVLVNHRKRFDDHDMMLNRSMRLSTPKTPYSRPGVNSAKKSPPTNELQVPTMSQLLQMKKILQNNTEKVREVATASNSILNQIGEYKLPDNNNSENASVRHGKLRNKITTSRATTKNLEEEYVQEVNLPNIPLPVMKNIPDIGLNFAKPKTIFEAIPSTSSTKTAVSQLEVQIFAKKSSPKEEANVAPMGKSQFKFSSPTQVKIPQFNKSIEPINNFKFSEPINVENSRHSVSFSATKQNLFVKPVTKDSDKTLQPLKNASVLDALNIPTAPVTSSQKSNATQPSLSLLFKSSSKQWECSCCMIRNEDTKDKCVACETPRVQPPSKGIEQTTSAPLANTFGSQFKANSNTWECSSCMIRNKLDALKCIACETPKPGGFGKSLSAMPKLTVPSNDVGFKSIVAQQSSRWECTACMTRNDVNRKKCECCEQAKPGGSSDQISSFSFGSGSASATTKFNFGVPFDEKLTSKIPTIERKIITGEVKHSFSFGAQPSHSETDGKTKILSFVDLSNAKDQEKKNDAPVATFSFGVKPSIISNENDVTASVKIASTPAPPGFKFSASTTTSQVKPVTANSVTFGSTNKSVDDKIIETKSNELVFSSKSEHITSTVSTGTSTVPSNLATTTNSSISFGSLNNDKQLPVFGIPVTKVDSVRTQIQPAFSLPISTTTQTSAAASMLSASNATLSSTTAPIFAFGQAQSAAKGGFSFTPTPVAKEKQAFPMPDFAQSQNKSVTPTLSFGSSNVTVTTVAPIVNSPSFFFGQPSTTSTALPQESSTSTFGATPSAPVGGFNFGPANTPSQAFGTQFKQSQATSVFAPAAIAITASLPTEPATSPFIFRSPTTIESTPSFGQSSAPTFGQPSVTPIQPFGCFGGQTQAPSAPFSSAANAFGSTMSNNGAPPTFGTSFGSSPNPSATPNFGSTGNNTISTFGISNNFGTTPGAFGSMIHTAPSSSDEPSAKKHSPGFGASVNNASIQKPPAYSFGDSSNNNSAKSSFTFSATASPSFNFSGSQQTNPSQPYAFGSSSGTPNAGVFNFGTETKSPVGSPFQFAGSSDVTNNLFAPQPSSTTSAAIQQRRKIRARRTPR